MDARHNGQLGLVAREVFDNPITVIGAGGIGSFTVLALAKIGFTDITVYDFDKLEEHNLGSQFYRLKDLKKHKVSALAEIVEDFEGTRIVTHRKPYTPDKGGELNGVLIAAVDSMEARKMVYGSVSHNRMLKGLVDGRMGGNQLEVYTVDMHNEASKKAYEKTLWSDEETSPLPCTEKAVMYNVLTIASWIVNQTRLLLSRKPFDRKLILDLENMMLVKV